MKILESGLLKYLNLNLTIYNNNIKLKKKFCQVNTNPYFGLINDFMKNILLRMIDEMLQLTIDPYFKPNYEKYTKSNFNNF